MSFTESVRTCLSKYSNFDGRARRSEFWWFFLFYQLVSLPFVIPGVLLILFGLPGDASSSVSPLFIIGLFLLIVGALAQLACIVPMLAVGCRRLHDYGQTGWWQLLLLLGGCGSIVLIVLWAMDTNPSDNLYGPVPE